MRDHCSLTTRRNQISFKGSDISCVYPLCNNVTLLVLRLMEMRLDKVKKKKKKKTEKVLWIIIPRSE